MQFPLVHMSYAYLHSRILVFAPSARSNPRRTWKRPNHSTWHHLHPGPPAQFQLSYWGIRKKSDSLTWLRLCGFFLQSYVTIIQTQPESLYHLTICKFFSCLDSTMLDPSVPPHFIPNRGESLSGKSITERKISFCSLARLPSSESSSSQHPSHVYSMGCST